MEKINLFISYAHADKEYLDEFYKFLNETDCPQINIWKDEKISLGQEWNDEIKNSLDCADIVLLIVSQDFLKSPYIANNELSVALKRHEEGKSTVIPIFLRYCNLEKYPQITKLQGYPGTNTPLLETGVKKDRHYTEIQEKINEIAKKIITKINISNSAAVDNGGERSNTAKEIEQLRNIKKIFLTIPVSVEGLELRKNFIITVDGKKKYDTPKWPYEIIPGIPEAAQIAGLNDGGQQKEFEDLMSQCIYSIHLVGSAADLKHGLFTMQYEQAKRSKTASTMIQNILWFANPSIKDELETLAEAFKIELKMLPTVVGPDNKAIFNLIEGFDVAKEQKINKLSVPFSPVKKIFMFYDFEKDNESELRIRLRKKLQEGKKFAIRDLADESFEIQKKGIEECNAAFIFYGSNCDSVWYKMRERIVLKANKLGAVCVDGIEEPEIEKKIDRDVSVNEILPIKGEKELEAGVMEFKKILQEEQ
ncbi:MAG: toll/interleukin receptor protein [Segetibacter sp.]|nr:toll/interleukin receptor protein [Segetibacter sp.]